MQINRITTDPPHRIILPENIIGGLFVILVHECAMLFSFFGEGVRGGAVAMVVGVVGLWGEGWGC